MIEVEVLIPNFKDKENFSKEITIIRNGKELKVIIPYCNQEIDTRLPKKEQIT